MARTIRQTTRREREIAGGRELELEFRLGDAAPVPGTLLLPTVGAACPAALLVHGYTSRKEHMAESVGRALLALGVGSLAIDLPLHGSRRDPGAAGSRSPLDLLRQWRLAVEETRLAAGYLRARPEVDGGRVGVVGYSLGSFLAVLLAAEDPGVRAVVVAAGGDLPSDLPFAALVRGVADPLRAVRRLAGRPLLVVHGRHDRTVRPEQAERLYAAAGEPREIRWWNAGHRLPEEAIREAAEWLARRLEGGTSLA